MLSGERWSRRVLLLLPLGVLLVGSCGDSTGTDDAGPPAAMEILDGDEQEGRAGAELPEPLVVRVTDEGGNPVPDQHVNWRVTTGGGSVFAGAGLTNSNGEVRERWTLGTVAGSEQQVEVRAVDNETGEPLVFATFSATALPGTGRALARVETNELTGPLGAELAGPISVKLTDEFGNPIAGATITFTVVAGGGSVNPASAESNENGIAATAWRLGNRLDIAHRLTASAPSATAIEISATPTLPADATTEAVGGGQTATVGELLAQPVGVRVRLAGGTPVVGANAAFTVTAGGGSVEQATVLTDEEGLARTGFRMGTAAGANEARVVVETLPVRTIAATGKAGAAATIERSGGTGQAGLPGTTIEPFEVLVVDQYRNAVSGATTTWAVVEGSGTVSPTSVPTSDEGHASSRLTLGTAGEHRVRVTAGSAPAIEFTATATALGDITWTAMASGTTERLNDVWGSSATNVFAVGNGGTILHYDGTAWTRMESGVTSSIDRIEGVAPNLVFAVSAGSLLRWNGERWSREGLYYIEPMFRTSDGALWIGVDNSRGTYRFDERFGIWSNFMLPPYNEFGRPVFCPWTRAIGGRSGVDLFATACDAWFHWNGSQWTALYQRIPNFERVWGFDGIGSVGFLNGGAYLNTGGDPLSWTHQPGWPNAVALWAASPSDLFAVDGSDRVHRYDGASWSSAAISATGALRGIHGATVADIFAVGDGGTIVHGRR